MSRLSNVSWFALGASWPFVFVIVREVYGRFVRYVIRKNLSILK